MRRALIVAVLVLGATLAGTPAYAAAGELRLPADMSDEDREQAIMNHAILTGLYLDVALGDDEDGDGS